jgi:hypothetical protein
MRGGRIGLFSLQIKKKKVGVEVDENTCSFSISGGKIPFSQFRGDYP